MVRHGLLIAAIGLACAAMAGAPPVDTANAALPVVVVTGAGHPDLEWQAGAPLAIAVFAGGETLRNQWRYVSPVRSSGAKAAVDNPPPSPRVHTAGR